MSALTPAATREKGRATLVAIPNVSEGRDPGRIASFTEAVEVAGTRVLDVHSDAIHHRSVITLTGGNLRDSLSELAAAASYIDLTQHDGAHPRLGVLDVCPIVPHDAPMTDAVDAAYVVGEAIWQRTGMPVYFYGEAAFREEAKELPDIRKGGLGELIRRSGQGFVPDIGSPTIDAYRGVVCVGARDVLIAFNVWIEGDVDLARSVARSIRTTSGGPPGVRALGLQGADPLRSQVSMNLVSPAETGIEAAFELVETTAGERGSAAVATQIVGLVPERFMPSPDAKATRLLIEPGRSLESMLPS